MARALYLLFGLLVIGGYGYASMRGLELKKTKKVLVPAGVRATTGGVGYYRGGYRGGK
ncbi:MAG TPA: hypothetical protein VEU30_01725 [Thermoanaerobaculia bacterium]|nr:hypothetical protein [Thermoanaerobaculia bacterium]